MKILVSRSIKSSFSFFVALSFMTSNLFAAVDVPLQNKTVIALSPQEEASLPPDEARQKILFRLNRSCQAAGYQGLETMEKVELPLSRITARELLRRMELSTPQNPYQIDFPTELIPSDILQHLKDLKAQEAPPQPRFSERYCCGWDGKLQRRGILNTLSTLCCIAGAPPYLAAIGDGIGFWTFSELTVGMLLIPGISCMALGVTGYLIANCGGGDNQNCCEWNLCGLCNSEDQTDNRAVLEALAQEWIVFDQKLVCGPKLPL